jgi:hypothetical protein
MKTAISFLSIKILGLAEGGMVPRWKGLISGNPTLVIAMKSSFWCWER